MAFTKGRLKRILLVLDYGLNVLLLGWHDEWVSPRAWRLRERSRLWAFMRRAIERDEGKPSN